MVLHNLQQPNYGAKIVLKLDAKYVHMKPQLLFLINIASFYMVVMSICIRYDYRKISYPCQSTCAITECKNSHMMCRSAQLIIGPKSVSAYRELRSVCEQCGGTAVAQWLRRCATNRKVTGSIPAGVTGFFIVIKSFRSHYGPGVDIRNEYQEHFLGVEAAGA